jgi:hypothetical protein
MFDYRSPARAAAAPRDRPAIRGFDRWTIRLAHHGASAVAARIADSQTSSSFTVRQLAVGNAPITPFRHAATTRSTPETRNIGAAISGSRNRLSKAANALISA